MAEDHGQVLKAGNPSVQPVIYEIRVKGRLTGDLWSQWFDGLIIMACDQGETVFCGTVPDQAALYGLLSRLRDLALPLLSVNRVRAPE